MSSILLVTFPHPVNIITDRRVNKPTHYASITSKKKPCLHLSCLCFVVFPHCCSPSLLPPLTALVSPSPSSSLHCTCHQFVLTCDTEPQQVAPSEPTVAAASEPAPELQPSSSKPVQTVETAARTSLPLVSPTGSPTPSVWVFLS